MKPDTMTTIAETLRSAVSDAVSKQYKVVDQKGEGVLYFRWAVTNMYLQHGMNCLPLALRLANDLVVV